MIFITVGSRSFQFDRLLKAVDEAVANKEIQDEIFAQVGSSTYEVKNFETIDFLSHEEFNKKLKECDIVLTHGGTGVIVNAVKMGKRVVAVPRLPQYHEAVDDHQIQLVKTFEKNGMVTGCYDCDKISEAIVSSKQKDILPYVSNTQDIIYSIDQFIASQNIKINSNNERVHILMCGSARSEKGGMNSVIDQLMDNKWDEKLVFSYLPTHISGNKLKKTLYFFKSYLNLNRLIKKDFFDIIHIHMSYKGSFYRKYYVTKLCKKYNKKVIIHLHGSEFKDFYNTGNDKRKKQIAELFSIADKIIVLGADWEKFILSIVPKANVVIINNAIRIPKLTKNKNNKELQFLFLGALIKRKGVIDLLNAVNLMKNNGVKNFKLIIAGEGEEENRLKSYVVENELSDNVKFLGWVDNDTKPQILMNADVLVLPSYNEGLPIAILEAMSYGLPIISTDVGSISEAVINDCNGFLIKPGDIDSLAKDMSKMVLDREYCDSLSSASRKICEDKFGDKKFFEKIQNIYLNL